jgi:DNA invertase Pin-like site-specific DNA recombinase
VWRYDRFSRSISELVWSLEEFRTLGVAFVYPEGTGCLVAGAA